MIRYMTVSIPNIAALVPAFIGYYHETTDKEIFRTFAYSHYVHSKQNDTFFEHLFPDIILGSHIMWR
jgi:hypothetical protein